MLGELMSFSDEINQQHGPYQDDLNSIGNEAFERAKVQVDNSNKYEDLEMPAAN